MLKLFSVLLLAAIPMSAIAEYTEGDHLTLTLGENTFRCEVVDDDHIEGEMLFVILSDDHDSISVNTYRDGGARIYSVDPATGRWVRFHDFAAGQKVVNRWVNRWHNIFRLWRTTISGPVYATNARTGVVTIIHLDETRPVRIYDVMRDKDAPNAAFEEAEQTGTDCWISVPFANGRRTGMTVYNEDGLPQAIADALPSDR